MNPITINLPTHIPQVLLVVLQIIYTLHEWCSSLIRITSNSVVQMYYSIYRVNLRNVGTNNLQQLIKQVVNQHTSLKITNQDGADFIVISAEDWDNKKLSNFAK